MIRQDRAELNRLYTEQLPEKTAALAAERAAARDACAAAQAEADALDFSVDTATAVQVAVRLVEAQAAEAAALAPRNFPVNFVFTPDGPQCFATLVTLWRQDAPSNHQISDSSLRTVYVFLLRLLRFL